MLVELERTVGSRRCAFGLISSPPVWKYGLKGEMRGRRSLRRVCRKVVTEVELRSSSPEGGSAEKVCQEGCSLRAVMREG